jgi:hypothetical protein
MLICVGWGGPYTNIMKGMPEIPEVVPAPERTDYLESEL